MQPPETSEELAEIYPDLEPWQRDYFVYSCVGYLNLKREMN